MSPAADRLAARRRAWLAVHRWLGLIVGPGVIVICLSGIALTYEDVIDNWLHPELKAAASSAPPAVSYAALADAVETRCPAGTREGVWLWMPHGIGVVRGACETVDGETKRRAEISVDGRDGRVILARDYGATPLGFIVNFHTKLLIGETGKWITSALATVMAISAVTGLYLWWPRNGGLLRALQIFPPYSGPRFWRAVHKSVGAVVSLVLLLVGVSALRLQFPDVFAAPLGATGSPYERGEGLKVLPAPGPRMDVDRLVSKARAEFPGAIVTDVYIGVEPTKPLLVGLRQNYEFNKDAGSSLVWLNPYTGDVLLKHDPFNAGTAQTILLFLESAHSGEILGEGGRTFVVICAASTVALLLSGFTVWRGRARKRQPI